MSNNVIYGLIDPNTQELRYVGYSKDLKTRMRQHYQPANLKRITHKNNWLKSLINLGQKAEVYVIEKYDTPEELPQAEIEMIAYYRYVGCDLTNGTYGGDGATGRIVSEETRKKVSIANTGKKQSPEAIAAWKIANMGKPSPNKGKKASPELRKKLSFAHIGVQGKKRFFTDEEGKELLEEYNGDPEMTIDKLAQKYSVSRHTIFRVFKRLKSNIIAL